MLRFLHELVERFLQPPTRARELRALRRGLASVRRGRTDEDRRAEASRMRDLRRRLSDALGAVASCTSCSVGCSSSFPGGDCCSGETAEIFAEHELEALAMAGTRWWHLRAPRGEHAGCAFRGARGCTLKAEHRPGTCLAYSCRRLRRELHLRGDAGSVQALVDELESAVARFRRN